MTENEISNKIIGPGIEVHSALGPGLLESAYKECFYFKNFQFRISCRKEKDDAISF